MAFVSNVTKEILELERSMKQPPQPKQQITYDTLMSEVFKALPELPPALAGLFETGVRGHAVEDLVYKLVLDKVPGLEMAGEITGAYDMLQGAYRAQLPDAKLAKDYAMRDFEAVIAIVDKHLPGAVKDRKDYASLEGLKAEARKRYPNLEDMGLQFSELFPKPFRSSLIEPMLLQRVPGLDAKKELHDASTQLTLAYNEVPKKDGGRVEQVQAAEIAKTARRITGEVLDEMLGKQISR